MTQEALDFTSPIPVNVSVIASEAPRLSKQCRLILERLRTSGPATDRELSEIALKYTSRISEIRAAGHNVHVIQRNSETGLTVYKLTI